MMVQPKNLFLLGVELMRLSGRLQSASGPYMLMLSRWSFIEMRPARLESRHEPITTTTNQRILRLGAQTRSFVARLKK
jgi:hypothetical protein